MASTHGASTESDPRCRIRAGARPEGPVLALTGTVPDCLSSGTGATAVRGGRGWW
ncbi:hypothetical protein SSCG_03660 [Streptomyces clavuligerus]|nr:hypothetical protein SSCG_03660 [Streptomyces clavuligerus]